MNSVWVCVLSDADDNEGYSHVFAGESREAAERAAAEWVYATHDSEQLDHLLLDDGLQQRLAKDFPGLEGHWRGKGDSDFLDAWAIASGYGTKFERLPVAPARGVDAMGEVVNG